MSFRDDTDALVARRDALRDKRARHPHDPRWQAEWARIRAEIDATRTGLAQALVDRARVAKRCDARWDSMAGGEHVRECAHCDKRVYQLSGLTAVEAAELLTGADGELCLRLYRRRDGTVMTSDCQEGARRRWRRSLRVVGVVAGVAACVAGTQALSDEVARAEVGLWDPPGPSEVSQGVAPYDMGEEVEPGYTVADAGVDLRDLSGTAE